MVMTGRRNHLCSFSIKPFSINVYKRSNFVDFLGRKSIISLCFFMELQSASPVPPQEKKPGSAWVGSCRRTGPGEPTRGGGNTGDGYPGDGDSRSPAVTRALRDKPSGCALSDFLEEAFE